MSKQRLVLAGTGAVLAILLLWIASGNRSSVSYSFAELESGPLTASVVATGTVEAVVTVEVGSELSGRIDQLLADFNTEVQAGELIAVIDPGTFAARVEQAEAELEVARASVAQREADIARTEARLRNAERTLTRQRELEAEGFASAQALDTALSDYESAQADVLSAQAGLLNAKAVVRQREASLSQAQLDLDRTEIRSPVDGVVIERDVDVGQTVAASLQAPKLFSIAQDLTDMQIATNIDEADIGRVEVGQTATFQVDAYPRRRFQGTVRQVRLAAQDVQDVQAYTVIIEAPNENQALLPGMTANVSIIVAERASALRVPNVALRFRPKGAPPPQRARSGAGGPPQAAAQRTRGTGERPMVDTAPGTVWVMGDDRKPEAAQIRIGISDGDFTEVVSGDLNAGDQVILRETIRD